MAALGTAVPEHVAAGDTRSAIAEGEANAAIRAPDSLDHRYYAEDFGFGLVPMLELARIGGVETPLARSLVEVASALLGRDLRSGRAHRTAARDRRPRSRRPARTRA